MVNDCIRLGLEQNKTSFASLSSLWYRYLKRYEVDSRYKLGAISRAKGIIKNYRKLSKRHAVRRPYCTQPTLTTCYGTRRKLQIKQGKLVLPSKIEIPLNQHTLRVLHAKELRAVTLTDDHLSIAFSKEVVRVPPSGLIGVDTNLDNVTTADSLGKLMRYDMEKATEIKLRIRQTKRAFTRNDARIRRAIWGKYGEIERNRVLWILHNTSSSIVNYAKKNKLGIVLENLSGIKESFRRGDGRGRELRARMNSWSFRALQMQIEYKAKWEGLTTRYVNPRRTSATCSGCGDRMFPEENRLVRCVGCGIRADRDENAANNIRSAGMRFIPLGEASEALKGNPTVPVIPGVDAPKLTSCVFTSQQNPVIFALSPGEAPITELYSDGALQLGGAA